MTMQQQAKNSALFIARQWMPRRALFATLLIPAILVTALGAPLSQMLRLEVLAKDEHAQYEVVFAGNLEDSAQRKTADSKQAPAKDSDKHEQTPRILKPISDIWESASRVQFSLADVPLVIELASDSASGVVYHPEFVQPLYRNHSPPLALARGPPANA